MIVFLSHVNVLYSNESPLDNEIGIYGLEKNNLFSFKQRIKHKNRSYIEL